jgi:hypothetical protein
MALMATIRQTRDGESKQVHIQYQNRLEDVNEFMGFMNGIAARFVEGITSTQGDSISIEYIEVGRR